jgi:hypothetical protein
MIEQPRKRGPFDPRSARPRIRRHLHLVAPPTPSVPEDAAFQSWEAEGGASYAGDERVVSMVARLPLAPAIE